MDDAARAAYVVSQAACANARVAAMQAENQHCALTGCTPVYGEKDFDAIQLEYMIGHNSVIEYLRAGR